MRILIAVPTFENILPECFKAIYDLDKCGHEVSFEFVKGYDCAKARNVIARKTIDGKYDYVMMVDSDTIVPENALGVMLEGSADIVMGCVPKKNVRGETVLFASKDNLKGKGFHKVIRYDDPSEKVGYDIFEFLVALNELGSDADIAVFAHCLILKCLLQVSGSDILDRQESNTSEVFVLKDTDESGRIFFCLGYYVMYAVAERDLYCSLILGISGNKVTKYTDDAVLDAPVSLSFGNELLNGFLIAFLTSLDIL